ncbi:MAG TPA: hypothetical protein VGN18_00880 [Jatrophihabitans sp.]|jgi:hypothetical protein|uniref:hypothetical protein n=1 Tax=Jatrophihabitans sp. TaxID=1932789 RepID=UPI002E02FD90|nr:hypothetical protein [Jatrophihabitans sp.]
MTGFDDDFSVADGTYNAEDDPFEETVDELFERLIRTDALADNVAEVGGGRQPAVLTHANDWDFTIKWPNGTYWREEYRTPRINVHYRPNVVGGWTFGSMWIDGLSGESENINQMGPSQALLNAVAAAWTGNRWNQPDPSGARF